MPTAVSNCWAISIVEKRKFEPIDLLGVDSQPSLSPVDCLRRKSNFVETDIVDWNQLSGPQRMLLRKALLSAYPRSQSFDIFLGDRLDKGTLNNIVGPGGYEAQIFEFLPEAEAGGWTDRLVDALQQDRPDNLLVRNLPNAVRAAGAEPPGRLTSSSFTLEKIVQGGGFSDVRLWAQSLALISEATCRVESPSGTARGTGILIEPDLVLTNFHVVEELSLGQDDVVCRFNYANDTSGLSEGTPYGLAGGEQSEVAESPYDRVADITGKGLASLDCLDYALLRLKAPVEGTQPIPIKAGIAPSSKDLPVLIVQHPRGRPQALAIGKSLGITENGSRFRYDADTLAGSSGSGVFNQKLELIALHHAGDPTAAIVAEFNQGIPIGLIAASISQKRGAKAIPGKV
ncbi:trypsin-like peptidase domain-containing protein [Mesorhizobium sp. WSM4303]|uniref:trypsin-like peptidase domain-containing protein n=1 Tax=unclassified Mesorhizobium TaxID=325217 RepID=UPI00115D3999|nr:MULTISPECIES: trypsin-like peptidase domain-containing protein [unclassified Mesorhizobium]TRC96099.1 trypsin-like peptidase domain-containing protein [Mesorhizobium sp. WSM4306]TRC98191.1 trypsin-like peptidase domain-containing protein [Mesorhizobium sp. WSM4303]